MTEQTATAYSDWPRLVQSIKDGLLTLDECERRWLEERLAMIAITQRALDELFRQAGGNAACAACDGTCCDCGRHHFTLTNLVACLLAGEDPPTPDFGCACPFLGTSGCRLPVDRRPYNCITFFCETLDDRMSPDERTQLRLLDRVLRCEYEQVARRYPAASLRGLWIALQHHGVGQLLLPADKSC